MEHSNLALLEDARAAASDTASRGQEGAVRDEAGVVVVHDNAPSQRWDDHERATVRHLAERLAMLLGYRYADPLDAGAIAGRQIYAVPRDTLLEADAAALGVCKREDLFGGIVPAPVLKTKLIAHPLFDNDALCPSGWCSELGARTAHVTLPGYAAFSKKDLVRAAHSLLRRGPVRLKAGDGIGGHGQCVAHDGAELDDALDRMSERQLADSGVAVEINLPRSLTYSIGELHLAGRQYSYYGMQRTTVNNEQREVYAGSDLHVVPGDLEALLAFRIPPDIRLAIRQVRHFHAAVLRSYPTLVVSRNNYDVIQGFDVDGRPLSGVLEQSWRIGGASPAEIAAVEAFARHPELPMIKVSSMERYGAFEPPRNALIHFSGIDSRVGQLVKFTIVETYEHSSSVIHHTS